MGTSPFAEMMDGTTLIPSNCVWGPVYNKSSVRRKEPRVGYLTHCRPLTGKYPHVALRMFGGAIITNSARPEKAGYSK